MGERLETLADGMGFVEGLRWHDGRLWFSDFGRRRVCSLVPGETIRDEIWVPGQPSGLGFTPSGDLMVVSVHEGHVIRRDAHDHVIVADIGADYRGGLNDMLVTPQGNAYVSAFPEPLIGRPSPAVPEGGGDVPLFLVRADGSKSRVAEHLKIPNGMVLSPDGSVLFVAETMGNRIVAYDVSADGTLGEPRTYCALEHRNPDGLSIDSQGRIWVGCPFVSEFVRLDTDGKIDLSVSVGEGVWAVACAVGETDDDVFLGCARTSIEDYQIGKAEGVIMRWQAG